MLRLPHSLSAVYYYLSLHMRTHTHAYVDHVNFYAIEPRGAAPARSLQADRSESVHRGSSRAAYLGPG